MMLSDFDPVAVPVTSGVPDPPAGDDGAPLAAEPLGMLIAVPEPTLGAAPLLVATADEAVAEEEPTMALPLGKLPFPAADEEAGAETVTHCTEQELAAGTLDTSPTDESDAATEDGDAAMEDAKVGDPLLAGALNPDPAEDGDAALEDAGVADPLVEDTTFELDPESLAYGPRPNHFIS